MWVPGIRGLRWEPLAPWRCARAFRLACWLAAEPAQDVSGLDVLGSLDVLACFANALLELRFKRDHGWWWWWQSGCPFHGDLSQHIVQLFAVLFAVFSSDQGILRLKDSQGTPPV